MKITEQGKIRVSKTLKLGEKRKCSVILDTYKTFAVKVRRHTTAMRFRGVKITNKEPKKKKNTI